MKASAPLLLVALLATSCSTARHSQESRFQEQERANLIVRSYSDDTNYVLKPTAKEGPFLAVLSKDAVVEMARQQAQRELAVVVLIHYCTESESDMVKEMDQPAGRSGLPARGLPARPKRHGGRRVARFGQ